MVRFLFMADCHVKSRTWTNFTRLSGDAYTALDRVAGLVPADADTLVIGGDWFDGNRPSSEDVIRSMSFVRRFGRVLFVRGNHDSVDPSYLLSDNMTEGHEVLELGQDPVSLHGRALVYGISGSPSRNVLLDGLAAIRSRLRSDLSSEGRAFVVLHTGFRHLLGIDGMWTLETEDVERIFEGAPVPVDILAGHVHERDTRQYANGCVHSPGSLYPLSWDRTQVPCFASLVSAESGDIEDVPCTVRQYASVQWTCAEALLQETSDIVRESVVRGYLEPMVRVVLPDGCGDSVPPVPGAVVQLLTSSGDDVPDDPRDDADGLSIEDAVSAETEGLDVVHDLAMALMQADDPSGEIASWLDYWGITGAGGTAQSNGR